MKNLVIVESPTKAKTITKFLDKGFTIKSSFGHIRDLPKSKMGVDIKNDFEPEYTIPAKSKKTATELKKLAKEAEIIYLATDEDREGEAIAWHLQEIFKADLTKVKRITFHQITKNAILEALANAHDLNIDLVNAQQARRVLDRLVGYELSPFLWKKVARGLSAGRVQSVAVRLIVEREEEIKAFKAEEYWSVDGLATKDEIDFEISLFAKDNKTYKKFDLQDKEAKVAAAEIKKTAIAVSDVTAKEVTKKAPTPLTTSTLQQDAIRKLGFSAKQTMMLAQQLYEGIDLGPEGSTGLITYMRTDSLTLASEFTSEAKSYISETFGADYALARPRTFAQTSKLAQEAHEAIRPTSAARAPQSIKQYLDDRQFKLYNLIWSRTLACQMADAKVAMTTVDFQAEKTPYTLRSNGSVVKFPGWQEVYKGNGEDKILPELKSGDAVELKELNANQHFTQPPARYSEAGLVKALEERGIGRPSTYAPTISTIIERGYVEKQEDKRLHPTDIGTLVTNLLVEHFKDIVDYDFTADIEDKLDQVAEGKVEWHDMIGKFYAPFHANLEEKQANLSRADVMRQRVVGQDPVTGFDVIVRQGRFGAYVQLGDWTEADKKAKKEKPRSASLPKGVAVETITLEECMKLLQFPKVLGKDEEGYEIVVNVGRYGPYINRDKLNASIPDNLTPSEITLEQAIEILDTAKTKKDEMAKPLAELGEDPVSQKPIVIKNGRFGPYITDGKTNVSLGKKLTPEDVTSEMAIEMLEKKRKAPKRSWRGKK